jgi:hypothetical protein
VDSLIANINLHIKKNTLLLFHLLSTGETANNILLQVEDSCIGKPYYIDINGKKYTPNILQQICLVSILSHMENLSKINKIIGIGGGYGVFGEIICNLCSVEKLFGKWTK